MSSCFPSFDIFGFPDQKAPVGRQTYEISCVILFFAYKESLS